MRGVGGWGVGGANKRCLLTIFISLVNDNHVDNNLKEILMFVYYGLIVNSRPKNISRQEKAVIKLCFCTGLSWSLQFTYIPKHPFVKSHVLLLEKCVQ